MFFELGLKTLMYCRSILCYITPKFYMLNKEDKDMREYFMDHTRINFLAFCNPFQVVTENVITLITLNKAPQNDVKVYRYDIELKAFEEDIPLDLIYSKTNQQKEWITGITPEVLSILLKMNTEVKLKDISISKRGAEISKNDMRATESGLASLIGQDMRKYAINWNNTYMSTSHREYNRLKSYFSTNMIYLRRVDSCLEATISDSLYGFNKNVYGIKINTSKGYSIKFVLALLNSKVLDFYYKKKFSTKKEDVFPEIQTYLYEQLPIPPATEKQQDEICSLVDVILDAKRENNQTDTTILEKQIDAIIYQLYYLTDDEIKLIEQA